METAYFPIAILKFEINNKQNRHQHRELNLNSEIRMKKDGWKKQ